MTSKAVRTTSAPCTRRSRRRTYPEFRANAERLLGPLSVKHRWEHRDERSVELAALVERARLDEVMTAGEELRAASPEVPFLLSGPWPLEVFADADRE